MTQSQIRNTLETQILEPDTELVVGLETVGLKDIARVGGKNASLGEMIQGLVSQGIHVPGGFATTERNPQLIGPSFESLYCD